MVIDITIRQSRERWPANSEVRPLVIGMAGGSASGKTTIADAVAAQVDEGQVSIIQHDAYYRDLSHLTPAEREAVNFDHPDALETELLIAHLEALRAGRAVERPIYDFSPHVRRSETVRVESGDVVIVEGILVLSDPGLRELFDLCIYVDTDSDLRVLRRLRRDIVERGRSVESVIDQYMDTVRPMHLEFVEPSKRYADLIVFEGYNAGVIDTVTSLIRDFLATR